MVVAYFIKGQESKLYVPDELLGEVQRKFSELLLAVAQYEEDAGKIAA